MRLLALTLALLFTLSNCDNTETIKAEKDALIAELKAKDEALIRARQDAKNAHARILAHEQANKEAFIKAQEDKKQKEENSLKNQKLSNIGIDIQDNTITIDTNKTKSFFQNIGKTLEKKMQQVTKDLQNGQISQKEAGVNINQGNINIDLNKTKDFLSEWGEKMQGFVKEFDTIAKEMYNTSK